MYTADEAFLCGTAAEVVPMSEMYQRPLASNGRGPITKEIQQTFFAGVHGEEDRYNAWN